MRFSGCGLNEVYPFTNAGNPLTGIKNFCFHPNLHVPFIVSHSLFTGNSCNPQPLEESDAMYKRAIPTFPGRSSIFIKKLFLPVLKTLVLKGVS